jgi:hypothetical protein
MTNVTSIVPPYRPTAKEQTIIDEMRADTRVHTLPPWEFVQDENGQHKAKPVHDDQTIGLALTMHAIGASSAQSMSRHLNHLLALSRLDGVPSVERFNELLSGVAGFAPRNEAELMLAERMVVAHQEMLTVAKQMQDEPSAPLRQKLERLNRTHVAQVTAFARLREVSSKPTTSLPPSVASGVDVA